MEELAGSEKATEAPDLHPPPPDSPCSLEPGQVVPSKYSIITRHGVGTAGNSIPLLANHFQVSVNDPDAIFFQYSVCLPSLPL